MRGQKLVVWAAFLSFTVGGLISTGAALTAGPTDVYVRVVDVGSGLCTITRAPDNHYMVYDAGHWNGNKCIEAAREIIGGEPIDLLVISHSDADHLGDAPDILEEFEVRKILRTGYERWDSRSWRRMNDAIAEEAKFGASVINLGTTNLPFGTDFEFGSAKLTFIAGWHEWVGAGPTSSERRNAISIVMRLEYQGKSILFTGDTVGRRKSDGAGECKDAEKAMVDNVANVPLNSDVMTASHHGGNNGSATCFITAVSPEFVIFSAGSVHHHPTAAAAGRYTAQGVVTSKMFRTDRGDDEGGDEWDEGRVNNCNDKKGDDDVDIVLSNAGAVQVAYRASSTGC